GAGRDAAAAAAGRADVGAGPDHPRGGDGADPRTGRGRRGGDRRLPRSVHCGGSGHPRAADGAGTRDGRRDTGRDGPVEHQDGGTDMTGGGGAGTVVLRDRVLTPGTVVVEGGRILSVHSGVRFGDVDLGDDVIVAPGAVDLHSDAVEKLAEPRPGVRLPF